VPLSDLKVTTVSDREVLWWLDDAADGEGWATSREIVAQLGGNGLFVHDRPWALVAQRLSWLMRYGVVDREHLSDEKGHPRYYKDGKPVYGQRWKLTPIGEKFMRGSLTKGQQKDLDSMSEDRLVAMVEAIASSYDKLDTPVQFLTKRAWRYGTKLR
jgi:hypothetical protein